MHVHSNLANFRQAQTSVAGMSWFKRKLKKVTVARIQYEVQVSASVGLPEDANNLRKRNER